MKPINVHQHLYLREPRLCAYVSGVAPTENESPWLGGIVVLDEPDGFVSFCELKADGTYGTQRLSIPKHLVGELCSRLLAKFHDVAGHCRCPWCGSAQLYDDGCEGVPGETTEERGYLCTDCGRLSTKTWAVVEEHRVEE